MNTYKLFWGEIHTHTNLSDGNGTPEENFEIAQSHLDFWAMTDHAYDEEVFNLDYRQMGAGRHLLNERWHHVQQLCRENEQPGKFIPFLAYEWTNFRYGHHNVYYLNYDEPIRMPPTLPLLYQSLRNVEALVIPHHPAYPVGICGKDWDFHDDDLSPFVEIYSLHGSSEEPCGIKPLLTQGSWMGPGGSGGSVQEGLARGYRLGIIASSDSHKEHPGAYDNGLMAVYAEELTRRSLWESFRKRLVYGVTGDRIALSFRINGAPMGSIIRADSTREIRIGVVAWDRVERIDIIKNNQILHSFTRPAGSAGSEGVRIRFRFMVEWGWDCRGEREWHCRLAVPHGRILQAIPCYRGSASDRVGRGITGLSECHCEWRSRTQQLKYGTVFRKFADALALELECDLKAPLQFSFRCNGMERSLRLSPLDILRGSTVQYMEDIPQTNNGAHWRAMKTCAKIKVHRGYRLRELTLHLTHEEETAPPTRATDFYYVRVIQQNGQMAWSSPIWVEPR